MNRYQSGLEFGDAIANALGLADSEGWTAQKRLVENAREISQMGLGATGGDVTDGGLSEASANQMRTDAMAAFKLR
jgi:hypothetical protein